MIGLSITPDYDRDPWTDLDVGDTLDNPGVLTRVGLVRNGTSEGNAVVCLAVQMPDGSHVVAETTWKLFRMAYVGLAATPIVAEEVIDP